MTFRVMINHINHELTHLQPLSGLWRAWPVIPGLARSCVSFRLAPAPSRARSGRKRGRWPSRVTRSALARDLARLRPALGRPSLVRLSAARVQAFLNGQHAVGWAIDPQCADHEDRLVLRANPGDARGAGHAQRRPPGRAARMGAPADHALDRGRGSGGASGDLVRAAGLPGDGVLCGQAVGSCLAVAHRVTPAGSCSAKTNTQPSSGVAAAAEPSATARSASSCPAGDVPQSASFTCVGRSLPVPPSISAHTAWCGAWSSGDAAP